MGEYYNYTKYFNQLITNTETIIQNQEQINSNLEQIILLSGVITFTIILNLTIGIVKKVFSVR